MAARSIPKKTSARALALRQCGTIVVAALAVFLAIPTAAAINISSTSDGQRLRSGHAALAARRSERRIEPHRPPEAGLLEASPGEERGRQPSSVQEIAAERPVAAVAKRSNGLASVAGTRVLAQEQLNLALKKSQIRSKGDVDTEGAAMGFERVPLMYKRIASACVVAIIFVLVAVWLSVYEGAAFSCAPCCPCLKASLVTIQDFDHLVLVFLFLVGTCNIFTMACYLASQPAYMYVAVEVVGILAIAKVTLYVYFCIDNYDDKTCSRRRAREEEQEKLFGAYQDMLEDMGKMIENAQNSNAGMAELEFESKKRDFLRFLQWLRDHYVQLDQLPDRDATGCDCYLVFVKMWLLVFKETSIDPVKQPRLGMKRYFKAIVEDAEDHPTDRVQALAKALSHENVQFIHYERDLLEDKRAQAGAMKQTVEARRSIREDERQLAMERSASMLPTSDNLGHGEATKSQRQPVSWLQRGSDKCCVCTRVRNRFREGDAVMPCQWKAGCCTMTLHSPSHFTVIMGLVLGPVLCLFYVLDGYLSRKNGKMHTSHTALELGLLLFSLCMIVVARNYERIDKLMRLEHELEQLEHQREEVEKQRERVSEFFGNSQTIVDFWTSRTIPWLVLLKEAQERIQDSIKDEPSAVEPHITGLTDYLRVLYQKLGSVKKWRKAIADGGGDTENAKAFASWVHSQSEPGDLPALVASVNENMDDVSPPRAVPDEGGEVSEDSAESFFYREIQPLKVLKSPSESW